MRSVGVAVAIGVAIAASVVAVPASSSPRLLAAGFKTKIDAAARQEVASGRAAGAAVAILHDGDLVFARGYGRANLELAAPVNTKTVFRIGSLTKQFTAAGVLLLAEQRKLRIDDKLSLYLPNFPRANEVKLRDLLDHTSGIHNFTESPVIDKISTSGATVKELVADIADQSRLYDFEPGTGWWYSNSNYVLLGAVIEKVSGKSWADFMKSEIFEKLGMADTAADDAHDVVPGRASGYSLHRRSARAVSQRRLHSHERALCRRSAALDCGGYGALEFRFIRRQAPQAGVARGDACAGPAPQRLGNGDCDRLAGRESFCAPSWLRPWSLCLRSRSSLGERPKDYRP